MTLSIQENILRFEVSVDYVLLVQGFDGTDNLCCVQFCSLLIKSLLFSEVCKEFTTIQEVDEEVQLALRLESIVQSNNVRILDLFEDVSLSLSFNEKILLDKLILLQYFHGEWLSVVSLLHEVDLTE